MNAALAPDVVEVFSTEIGESSELDELRRAIATAFQRRNSAASVIFFELEHWTGRLVQTFELGRARPSGPTGFPYAGDLARWLRVNDEVLLLADHRDIWEYLSPDEQATVTALGAGAFVPLVADAELVACLAFCGGQTELGGHRTDVERCARFAARRWRDAVRFDQARTQGERLRRSQQLGVAGQMAASVAHEVRNPLAAVRSIVQFAREVEVPAAEREAMLDDVLQEVDRIDRTLTNMLQLSQPPSTELGLVNVTELVHSATQFVRAYARRQGVTLHVSESHPELLVVANARELRQVVTNILLNACQSCEGMGDVRVAARTVQDDGHWVEITIVDTGQGIAPDDLGRVFEPFFTTRPLGTGLGLPFCRDTIERFGGRIAIQSVRGSGTTVFVRLPPMVMDADNTSR